MTQLGHMIQSPTLWHNAIHSFTVWDYFHNVCLNLNKKRKITQDYIKLCNSDHSGFTTGDMIWTSRVLLKWRAVLSSAQRGGTAKEPVSLHGCVCRSDLNRLQGYRWAIVHSRCGMMGKALICSHCASETFPTGYKWIKAVLFGVKQQQVFNR